MMLRRLPAVDALADELAGGAVPRVLVVEVARAAIAEARRLLETGETADAAELARRELSHWERLRPARVINATGVLLHTNLGRAPAAPAAAEAAAHSARHYEPIEFGLDTGVRGGRGAYVNRLLTALTGAEAALVVNNNAGALYLALAALAGGGTVAVSRGELIEIGGSFRLPDLMAASGAGLIEVGTTNRTRAGDYEAVVGRVAALLKVHPSNYRVEGFAEQVAYRALAAMASEHGIPLVADIGSGLLDARVPWWEGPPPGWLEDEPAVRQTLDDGADVVLFSGDKLLGGPQAGIVVGRTEPIRTMARHPVARALRCGGPALASLAATLEMYAAGRAAELPFWEMAARPHAVLETRCTAVLASSGINGEVVAGFSLPGAGSVPGQRIPSPVISAAGRGEAAWRRLLGAPTPVVARRDEGDLVVDLRAVDEADDDEVAAALAVACR